MNPKTIIETFNFQSRSRSYVLYYYILQKSFPWNFVSISCLSTRIDFLFFIFIDRNELQWKKVGLLTQTLFAVTVIVKEKKF